MTVLIAGGGIGGLHRRHPVHHAGVVHQRRVQPVEQGPAQYGYSMRVASKNPAPPGVVALT